jgi:hypothetical protein
MDDEMFMEGFCCAGSIVHAGRLLYTGSSLLVSKVAVKDFHFTWLPQFKVKDMTEITPHNIAMAGTHVSESNLNSYLTYWSTSEMVHAISGSDNWRHSYLGYDKIELFGDVVSLLEDFIDTTAVQSTLSHFNEYVVAFKAS